jgi:hypothetical protein
MPLKARRPSCPPPARRPRSADNDRDSRCVGRAPLPVAAPLSGRANRARKIPVRKRRKPLDSGSDDGSAAVTLDHGPHSPATADPRSDQDPNDNQDLGPAQDGGAAEKAPWPVLDDRIESGDHPGFVGFDTSRAHPARIYDFLLGGKDNFAADRRAGTQVAELAPCRVLARRGRYSPVLGHRVRITGSAQCA